MWREQNAQINVFFVCFVFVSLLFFPPCVWRELGKLNAGATGELCVCVCVWRRARGRTLSFILAPTCAVSTSGLTSDTWDAEYEIGFSSIRQSLATGSCIYPLVSKWEVYIIMDNRSRFTMNTFSGPYFCCCRLSFSQRLLKKIFFFKQLKKNTAKQTVSIIKSYTWLLTLKVNNWCWMDTTSWI